MDTCLTSLPKYFRDMQSLYGPKGANDIILTPRVSKDQHERWTKVKPGLTDIAVSRRVVFPGTMVAMS